MSCLFVPIPGAGFCNSERTDEGVRGIFQWNETGVNTNTSTGCFYGPPDVIVTRFCVSRNNFAAPSLKICRTIAGTRFDTFKNVRYKKNDRQKGIQSHCYLATELILVLHRTMLDYICGLNLADNNH